ncbi:hypothetical protein Dfri01_58450 [Dyadobacter frigoris]|nr:hypothetical protein Dfri01_58450 [Dyadobacter frigoris]
MRNNGEIEITVNGLMQIINVKINYIADTDHLGKTFQATTNHAFELVNNKSKHAIASLAQSYGLPGL